MLKVGRCLLIAACVVFAIASTETAQAVSIDFDVLNHPAGNSQPPPYGLRLDYNSENHTFEFNGNVMASFDMTNKSMTFDGTVVHGVGNTSTGEVWTIATTLTWVGIQGVSNTDFNNLTEADLEAIKTSLLNPAGLFGSGSRLLFTVDSLTLTTAVVGPVYQGAVSWSGKANSSGDQFYVGTGHRSVSSLSAWGWVMTANGQTGTNDFLLTLEPKQDGVPEPATIALLTAGLGAVVSRRRGVL